MFFSPPQHGVLRVMSEKGQCDLLTDFPAPLNSYDLRQIEELAASGQIELVPGTDTTYRKRKIENAK